MLKKLLITLILTAIALPALAVDGNKVIDQYVNSYVGFACGFLKKGVDNQTAFDRSRAAALARIAASGRDNHFFLLDSLNDKNQKRIITNRIATRIYDTCGKSLKF
jgi:hypothetical protein